MVTLITEADIDVIETTETKISMCYTRQGECDGSRLSSENGVIKAMMDRNVQEKDPRSRLKRKIGHKKRRMVQSHQHKKKQTKMETTRERFKTCLLYTSGLMK